MLLDTPICEFGRQMPDFTLADPQGRAVRMREAIGPGGLLVAFVCNHCPYVKAIATRLGEDARMLAALGVPTLALMPNDWRKVPADAPEAMTRFAGASGWDFPYLVDEGGAVARAWGAVCTPDFFGLDATAGLQYRGRLDDARMGDARARTPELVEAMRAVAATGQGPRAQTPSMGCSIKWG